MASSIAKVLLKCDFYQDLESAIEVSDAVFSFEAKAAKQRSRLKSVLSSDPKVPWRLCKSHPR